MFDEEAFTSKLEIKAHENLNLVKRPLNKSANLKDSMVVFKLKLFVKVF